jgi:hypothetical protein
MHSHTAIFALQDNCDRRLGEQDRYGGAHHNFRPCRVREPDADGGKDDRSVGYEIVSGTQPDRTHIDVIGAMTP